MEETLKSRQESIIEEFALYDDWLDKYEYLIELGKNLSPLPEEYKTEEKLIRGCQSRVWLHAEKKGTKLEFLADSDALITKGIISLLVGVYSGREAEEIAADDFSFIDKLGLKENLSPTRANGLASMIATIKSIASQI